MTTGILGLLLGPVGMFSIFLTMSNPSMTRPKTTCFESKKSHLAHVTKNWQPLVSLPELAMESRPGPECCNRKFSSVKLGVFEAGGHAVAPKFPRAEFPEILGGSR